MGPWLEREKRPWVASLEEGKEIPKRHIFTQDGKEGVDQALGSGAKLRGSSSLWGKGIG